MATPNKKNNIMVGTEEPVDGQLILKVATKDQLAIVVTPTYQDKMNDTLIHIILQ